jgi:hypothetical protein
MKIPAFSVSIPIFATIRAVKSIWSKLRGNTST